MLVGLAGRERTVGEFESLFSAGGFRLAELFPSASGLTVIEATPDQ